MIPSWLSSLATGRAVLFALFVWFGAGVTLFLFGPYQTVTDLAQGWALPDQRWGYSWQDAMILFATLGEAGRRAYRAFLIADIGNAVLFASAFTLLLTFLASRLGYLGRRIALLAYLPGLVAFLDLIENAALLSALAAFADVPETPIGIAAAATTAKLSLGTVTMLVAATGIVAWGLRAMGKRSRAG